MKIKLLNSIDSKEKILDFFSSDNDNTKLINEVYLSKIERTILNRENLNIGYFNESNELVGMFLVEVADKNILKIIQNIKVKKKKEKKEIYYHLLDFLFTQAINREINTKNVLIENNNLCIRKSPVKPCFI